MELGLSTTLTILAGSLATFGLALWRHRRSVPGQPSLIPWGGLQYLALVVAVLMAAHVVTLLTGVPLVGRSG